jgi:methylaspartate mutase sigma subunit
VSEESTGVNGVSDAVAGGVESPHDESEPLVKVITGVIGVDAHVTGNWIVGQSLKSAGIEVISLGVCVPQQEFIEAAVETDADAIWVTSLYGHALLDCEGFRDRCVEMGIPDIVLYIGGMLVVGKHHWPTVEQQFLDAGFNRAYPPNSLPETAIKDLMGDLDQIRAAKESR